ncbi:MAG: DNA-dependent ATPase and helicase, partial [Bacteroidota bacterium]
MNLSETKKIKNEYETKFQRSYLQLNTAQKLAVDTIEGPVLVVAGPGTGKTQIIAARIANILSIGVDAKPHNILCLTYTDAGAIAMRKRLLEFIGPVAHKVNIYTFHAFCNDVIQHHPQFFLKRESEPVSDLELAAIYHELIDELPEGHSLRRLKGEIYFEAKRLKSLFSLMKKEDWSAEKIIEAIDKHIAELPLLEKFIYQTTNAKYGFKKGDPKQKEIDAEIEKMSLLKDAAILFEKFDAKMKARARYDYDDMILWVIKAFKENELLLLEYQERFQYVLVDEFQDTSGSQKEILELLISYWGQEANVFIVGDDDQSIYEFQGARLDNIVNFYEQFEESIKPIVLTNNYRSTQKILDASKATIDNNKQRLIHLIKKEGLVLDKNLVASNPKLIDFIPHSPSFSEGEDRMRSQNENEERSQPKDFPLPKVVEYYNSFHEEADIVLQLEKLHQAGQNLSEVAVLYSQHKQAANIIKLLEKKGIPYNVKKREDLLKIPLVNYFINVLEYLQKESSKAFSGEEILFHLMHYPALQINPVDIALLSYHIAQKPKTEKKQWRLVLDNALEISTLNLLSQNKIIQLGNSLNKWLGEMQQLTLPMLFENIIYDSGIVEYILNSTTRIWDMQVLNSFFDFIKEECAKKPRMHVKEFLAMLDEMHGESIELPINKVVAQANGVNFITAHSSKGLEFEYVFLIGCTTDFWEKKKGQNSFYKMPESLVGDEKINAEESSRRLFYVAITRAKKYLQISYPAKDVKEKGKSASMFIAEIKDECVFEKTSLPEADVMEQIKWSFEPNPPVNIEVLKKEFLEQRLNKFSLSASALNKYLKCPVTFYYETILQVPSAPNDSLAYGNAVHYALEMLFKDMQSHPSNEFAPIELVIKNFEKSMKKQEEAFTEKQFPRRLELGRKSLADYYHHYINTFNKTVSIEKMIPNIEIDGVPLKGKIDKIEFDGNNCTVIDYKTGNAKHSIKDSLTPPTDKQPNGGDYWRQMIFYKLLIDNYPFNTWKMVEGIFDFVEKNEETNEFVRHKVIITPDDVKVVRNQIKDSYTKIMNHEFAQGCNEEKCQWCNFVKTNKVNRAPEKTDE